MKLGGFAVIFWAAIFFIFVDPAFCEVTKGNLSEKLDFKSALNKIISRSTDISLAELSLETVKANNIPLKFIFLPTLSLNGTLPLSNNFLTSPRTFALSSQLNLFRWGADYFGLKSAVSSEESHKFAIDATLIVAEQDAVQGVIAAIQRSKEVTISSRIVQSQVELLAIARMRYERGFLSIQEVEKLSVDLANAKASLADSKMIENQARAVLENLLGQSDIRLDWPWLDYFKSKKVSFILGEDLQLSQRPDWRSAQREVQSQSEKVNQEWRLLLPAVDAQLSWGNYSSGYFGSFTRIVGMVSVTVPIFDQFKSYSSAKAQSYMKSSSEAKLEQVQRNSKSQWQASRMNFQTALESALAREETLKLSKKLFQDNFRRFQAGKINANDLTIDRARMNSAEFFAVQGWGAVHINFAELCHALGYRVGVCIETLPQSP